MIRMFWKEGELKDRLSPSGIGRLFYRHTFLAQGRCDDVWSQITVPKTPPCRDTYRRSIHGDRVPGIIYIFQFKGEIDRLLRVRDL